MSRAECLRLEAGQYLALYEAGADDPGSRCGYSDSELAQIKGWLDLVGLTIRADDRGLLVTLDGGA